MAGLLISSNNLVIFDQHILNIIYGKFIDFLEPQQLYLSTHYNVFDFLLGKAYSWGRHDKRKILHSERLNGKYH